MINSSNSPVYFPKIDRTFYLSNSMRDSIKSLHAYNSIISRIQKQRKDLNYNKIWCVFRIISKSILTGHILSDQKFVVSQLVELYNKGLPYHFLTLGVKLGITVWKLKLEMAGKDARVSRKLIKEGLHLTNILFKSEASGYKKQIERPSIIVGSADLLSDLNTFAIIDCSKTPNSSGIGIVIDSPNLNLNISFKQSFNHSSDGEILALKYALQTLNHLKLNTFQILTDSLSAYLAFESCVLDNPDLIAGKIVLSDRISTFRADRLACSFSFSDDSSSNLFK